MKPSLVQLSFALQSFEDPLSAAMAHNMEYDPLVLNADEQHQIVFSCVLPTDAHEDDVISLSATHLTQRHACYLVTYSLTQLDLERGKIELSFDKITTNDDYVLQILLHGRHGTLKDSAQFDVSINAYKLGYIPAAYKQIPPKKKHSLRHSIACIGSSLLSFF